MAPISLSPIVLLSILAMTNNGYLFAPTPVELAVAKANPDIFYVSPGDVIYDKNKKNLHAYGPYSPNPSPKHYDEFDYEGAILAKQEALLFDY